MIATYAAANAVLYSALLPLWEGFDEPFHFGYVQQLANGRALRDMRLSKEVVASLDFAPVSGAVKANLKRALTYDEFFSWPAAQRARARQERSEIPPGWRWVDSELPDYEQQQAPLAYALLAVPERLASGLPLPARVLLLRILAALAGAALLGTGAAALCRELAVAEPYRSVVLFCLFSSQMTWATMAHVANDWLAVPLAVWFLVLAIRGDVVAVSLVLAAGLLAKAYFIAMEPLVFLICAARRGWRGLLWHAAIVGTFAGPWYARNEILYGSLTGMQEARAGFGAAAAVRAAAHMNWPKVALDGIRTGLWTGNNTFRVFCTKTIDAVIVVLAAALLAWALSGHKPAERLVAAGCALWLAALAYDAALAHLMTCGASSTPSAWHEQVLAAPVLALAMLGASRWERLGAALAAALALLFGYVLAVTYPLRLIPLYAGFDGRATVRTIAALWHAGLAERLGAAALGPVWLVAGLTAVVLALVLFQEWQIIRQMLRANPSGQALRRGPAWLSRRKRCGLRAEHPAPARHR